MLYLNSKYKISKDTIALSEVKSLIDKILQDKNKVGLKVDLMTPLIARASILMMVDRKTNQVLRSIMMIRDSSLITKSDNDLMTISKVNLSS